MQQEISALLQDYFHGLYRGDTGFDYFDYLALLHDGERWQIVNKLFTHVAA